MRKWLYNAVVTAPLQQQTTGGRVFGTGAVEGEDGAGDSPNRPFIVCRFGTNQRGMGQVKQQRVSVWVHWDGASALPADLLIRQLEEWLPAQTPQTHGDSWVMDCVWEDTSGDGFDDHYQTNVRSVTFLITYRDGPAVAQDN